MTGCVNISRNFLLTGKREEGLREREREKSMYMQKGVTLIFLNLIFFSYCNKTRDLAGADAAM